MIQRGQRNIGEHLLQLQLGQRNIGEHLLVAHENGAHFVPVVEVNVYLKRLLDQTPGPPVVVHTAAGRLVLAQVQFEEDIVRLYRRRRGDVVDFPDGHLFRGRKSKVVGGAIPVRNVYFLHTHGKICFHPLRLSL